MVPAGRGSPGPLGGAESGEEQEKAGERTQPLSCRGGDRRGVASLGPGREPGTAVGVLESENGAKPGHCSPAPSAIPASAVMAAQTRDKIVGAPGL